MGRLIFLAVTGVLALLSLESGFGAVAIYGLLTVLGPLGIPLAQGFILLPTLWLVAAAFVLIEALLRTRIPAAVPRVFLSAAGVAMVGFVVFVALPAGQTAYQGNRAERIIAGDLPPPPEFPPARSLEIRFFGEQTAKFPHFGPGGCFDLCFDMLAAGVLDRVIIRTDTDPRVLSREKVADGCRSNLFSRKQQGREFRLELAGFCLVSTPLAGDANGYVADVTFVMVNDWQDRSFRLRQIQAFDRSGKMLFQQSEVAWEEAVPQMPVAGALQGNGHAVIRHRAGSPVVPFGWPEIAALLGLPQGGLADSTLILSPETDPATLTPPDVSFRMLELLAEKGALTDSERIVLAAMVLHPGFRPSDKTPAVLRAVLATRPAYGPQMAAVLTKLALNQIESGQMITDTALMQSLAVLRADLPRTSLPPVLAGLSVDALSDRWAVNQSLAIAATDLGEPSKRYLLPVLSQAEREAVNFRSPEASPAVTTPMMARLNAAVCTHAGTLEGAGEIWLSWATHHAAAIAEDRVLAAELGVSATHLGLTPELVKDAFAEVAGWAASETAALVQPATAPCPG